MMAALRHAVFRWQLRKTLSREQHEHAFLPFDRLKNIGMVVSIHTEEEVHTATAWQKRWAAADRQVDLLLYYPSRQAAPFPLPDAVFTNKGLSFGYQPKVDKKWTGPYDALLLVGAQLPPPFAHLAAQSKATMRVGPHDAKYENGLDLMVAMPENNPSLDTIFNTFERYLKMIDNHATTR